MAKKNGRFESRGMASWYSNSLQGRKTASGEFYDSRAMTAAHRTLPFGTLVRVRWIQTGKTVSVRINDRGPNVAGRVLDLSYAAARKLGIVNQGEAEVELAVVN